MKKQIKPVAIVGAGPGDSELLTLKAHRLLQSAEIVVYDRLISEDILAMINHSAEKIYAGKSCKSHTMKQEEINQLLVNLAKTGKNVVRLKGGDPFIFGRGGEEAEFLASNNIPFEVVAGVTTASAVSAYNKIPLTHRGLADNVRYITGHYKDAEKDLNWQSLADENTTLVVYMGLANLVIIARKLIDNGLPENFPVAAIENATFPTQKIVISDLKNIASKVAKVDLKPPTIIIIGRVVSLFNNLIL